MTIRGEQKTILTIGWTDSECAMLNEVQNAIEFLCDSIRVPADLISPTTGEVIEMADLRRTLGVLNGLLGNPCWELNVKEVEYAEI